MATPEPAREEIFLPGGQLCLSCVSESTLQVLQESLRLARETRWDTVRSPHVFMGLLSVPDPGVRTWGVRLQADLNSLLGQFQELFHQDEGDSKALLMLNREFLSDNVIHLLRDAHARAREHRRSHVTPMDLLIILLTSGSVVAECFERAGFRAAKLTELAVLAEQESSRS